jgi:hypothetical protein
LKTLYVEGVTEGTEEVLQQLPNIEALILSGTSVESYLHALTIGYPTFSKLKSIVIRDQNGVQGEMLGVLLKTVEERQKLGLPKLESVFFLSPGTWKEETVEGLKQLVTGKKVQVAKEGVGHTLESWNVDTRTREFLTRPV